MTAPMIEIATHATTVPVIETVTQGTTAAVISANTAAACTQPH